MKHKAVYTEKAAPAAQNLVAGFISSFKGYRETPCEINGESVDFISSADSGKWAIYIPFMGMFRFAREAEYQQWKEFYAPDPWYREKEFSFETPFGDKIMIAFMGGYNVFVSVEGDIETIEREIGFFLRNIEPFLLSYLAGD